MNKRSKAIIASGLLVFGTVTAVGTALARGDHDWGRGPKIERMMERLDLSVEQRDAVQAILDDARPAMDEFRKNLWENRQKLRDLARADTADETAIETLAETQGKIMADMIVERTEIMRAVRAVLTPEQRAQAEQLMERHGGRGSKGF